MPDTTFFFFNVSSKIFDQILFFFTMTSDFPAFVNIARAMIVANFLFLVMLLFCEHLTTFLVYLILFPGDILSDPHPSSPNAADGFRKPQVG